MNYRALVLTLQQIVLSKNHNQFNQEKQRVLTLQQIVLSKNLGEVAPAQDGCFDFTTNCSF